MRALAAPPRVALRAAPRSAALRRCGCVRGSAPRRAAAMTPARASAVTDVLALDFDGVICDSVGESAQSAWRAALKLWPDVFNTPEAAAQKARVLEEMKLVRPVVETGYENLLQVRLLLEARPGTRPDDILERWGELLPRYMAEWKLERAPLVELFGSTRDEWMKEDLAGWLSANRFYNGVPEALRAVVAKPELDMYIVTTKQARFTQTLLRDLGGVDLPMERIFSQTVSGRPKTEVLEKLAAAAPPGARLVFFEDKLSTLETVQRAEGFGRWELYLADWGYNTRAERERVEPTWKGGRIRVVDLYQFPALLGVGMEAGYARVKWNVPWPDCLPKDK